MTQQPDNRPNLAGRGSKIGFLLAGSPDRETAHAVLEALAKLSSVDSVRIAWSDPSQVEYIGMSSFSGHQANLVERISGDLLDLPGFRVLLQGVNRVPHPVFAFTATPGRQDRNAARRRERAQEAIKAGLQGSHGVARIYRGEPAAQPSPFPPAGGEAGAETDATGRLPELVEEGPAWQPGRLAPTVREPGFENVKPRLRPATKRKADPIEPFVRSQYQRPTPPEEQEDQPDGEAPATPATPAAAEARDELAAGDEPESNPQEASGEVEWTIQVSEHYRALTESGFEFQDDPADSDSSSGPRSYPSTRARTGGAHRSGLIGRLLWSLNLVSTVLFGPPDNRDHSDSGESGDRETTRSPSNSPIAGAEEGASEGASSSGSSNDHAAE